MGQYQGLLMQIFQLLLGHFGPRRWWPAQDDFEVIVGAILTQSVSWKNVEKAIANLRALGLLHPLALTEATPEVLEEAVRPTRYYRQKAERLRVFCHYLRDRHNGDLSSLFSLETQDLRAELLALKGIGQETADSIILYAARKPIFVVDAYTRRIFHRLQIFPADISYDDMQGFFMRNLPPDLYLYNEFHALIDGLGNTRCSNRKPRCEGCPLLELCGFPSGEPDKSVES